MSPLHKDDIARRQPAARKARRGPADHLREALVALSGGHAIVADHSERAWASITFEGARHTLTLMFEGEAAAAAGEDFIADLPEHEFRIPGQLVADAAIGEVNHSFGADERIVVKAELLLLDEK